MRDIKLPHGVVEFFALLVCYTAVLVVLTKVSEQPNNPICKG